MTEKKEIKKEFLASKFGEVWLVGILIRRGKYAIRDYDLEREIGIGDQKEAFALLKKLVEAGLVIVEREVAIKKENKLLWFKPTMKYYKPIEGFTAICRGESLVVKITCKGKCRK